MQGVTLGQYPEHVTYRVSSCGWCHPELVEGLQRWQTIQRFISRKMKLSHHYYVYIVQCKDNFYYTGVTNNLEKRIDQHNDGKDIFLLLTKEEKLL